MARDEMLISRMYGQAPPAPGPVVVPARGAPFVRLLALATALFVAGLAIALAVASS